MSHKNGQKKELKQQTEKMRGFEKTHSKGINLNLRMHNEMTKYFCVSLAFETKLTIFRLLSK